jgi:hypothetical protein
MDIPRRVERTLGEHVAVRGVNLIGSRARGDPTPFSDWDFEILTDDFPSVSIAIPSLVASLRPIAQQWDRLSTHECYMLVLDGPEKVDLLFDVPHKEERRWTASASSLQAIDDHFWDWLLWLLSKEAAGRDEVVFEELGKMFDHLLEPMGVLDRPRDLPAAVHAYVDVRESQERRHDVLVTRRLEGEVRKAWTRRSSGLA